MIPSQQFLQLLDQLNERVLQCSLYSDRCDELALLRGVLAERVRSMASGDLEPVAALQQRYDARFMNHVVERDDLDDKLLRERQRRTFDKKQQVVRNMSGVVDSVGDLRRLFNQLEQCVAAFQHLPTKLFSDKLLASLDVSQATQLATQRTQHNILDNFYSPLEVALINYGAQQHEDKQPIPVPEQVWSRRLTAFAAGQLCLPHTTSVDVLKAVNACMSRTDLPLANQASHIEGLLDASRLQPCQQPSNVLLQQQLEALAQRIAKNENLLSIANLDELCKTRRIAPGVRLARMRVQIQYVEWLLSCVLRDASAMRSMVRECEQLGRALHLQASFRLCRHVNTYYSDSLRDMNEGVLQDVSNGVQRHLLPQLTVLRQASCALDDVRLFLLRWRERSNVLKHVARQVADYRCALDSFNGDITSDRVSREPRAPAVPGLVDGLRQLMSSTQADAMQQACQLMKTECDAAMIRELQQLSEAWRAWRKQLPPSNTVEMYDHHKIRRVVEGRIVVGRDMPATHLSVLRRVVEHLKEAPEMRVSHSDLFEGQVLRVYSPQAATDLLQFLQLFMPVLRNALLRLGQPPQKQVNKDKPDDNKTNKDKTDDNKTNKDKPEDKKEDDKLEELEQKDEDVEELEQKDEEEDVEEEHKEVRELQQPYLDARRTLLLLVSLASYCDAKYGLSQPPHLLNLSIVRLALAGSQFDEQPSLNPASTSLTQQLQLMYDSARSTLTSLQQSAHQLQHLHQLAWRPAMDDIGRAATNLDDRYDTSSSAMACAAVCEWRQALLEVAQLPRSSKFRNVLADMEHDVAAYLSGNQSIATILAVQLLLLPLACDTSAPRHAVLWACGMARKLLSSLDKKQIDQALFACYAENVLRQLVPDTATSTNVTPQLAETRGMCMAQQALETGDVCGLLMLLVLDDARSVGVTRAGSIAELMEHEREPDARLGHGWLFAPLVWACMNPRDSNRSDVVNFVNWTWVVRTFPPVYSNGVAVTSPVVRAMLASLRNMRSLLAAMQCYFAWVAQQQTELKTNLLDVALNWQLNSLHTRAVVWLYGAYCCVCRMSCKLLNYCGEPPQSFRVWLHTSLVEPEVRDIFEGDYVFE